MATTDPVLLAVKAELQTDPASVGYAAPLAASDFNALVALLIKPISQSPKVFKAISITANQIIAALIKLRKWEPIVIAANSVVATGHADAFLLVQLQTIGSVTDDFTGSAYSAILANLKTASLLVQADIDALTAIAQIEVLRSRADILGVVPTTSMIQQALS